MGDLVTIDVGFTGTRRGVMTHQDRALRGILRSLGGVLGHGCCVGADREAHAIWRGLGRLCEYHPGDINQENWAIHNFGIGEEIHTRLPYLQRNKVIVDRCGVLVAAPGEAQEQLRSGTWSTIRYARRVGRPVIMVLPDGVVVR